MSESNDVRRPNILFVMCDKYRFPRFSPNGDVSVHPGENEVRRDAIFPFVLRLLAGRLPIGGQAQTQESQEKCGSKKDHIFHWFDSRWFHFGDPTDSNLKQENRGSF